jgi:hypothetical protein
MIYYYSANNKYKLLKFIHKLILNDYIIEKITKSIEYNNKIIIETIYLNRKRRRRKRKINKSISKYRKIIESFKNEKKNYI